MKIITPTTMTDAKVVSIKGAGVVLPESVPQWSAATAYALLQQVTYQHRIYERRVAGTSAGTPAVDTANWRDVSASNPWMMFDVAQNLPTVSASPLEVKIKPGRVNALYLQGISGSAVTVTMTSAGETVYSHSEGLDGSIIASWYDYFFADFAPKTTMVRLDLPPYLDGEITVTLSSASGAAVSIGYLIVGDAADLGQAVLGASRDTLDFSLVERDAYGGLRLRPGKTVPKTSQQIVVYRQDVTRVVRKLGAMTGRPGVWLGVEVDTDAYFEPLAVLGVLRRATLNVAYYSHAHYDLEIEGM